MHVERIKAGRYRVTEGALTYEIVHLLDTMSGRGGTWCWELRGNGDVADDVLRRGGLRDGTYTGRSLKDCTDRLAQILDSVPPCSLARTKAALVAYDTVTKEFAATVASVSNAEGAKLYEAVLAAEQEIREAFALDTADRNPRDKALLMRPTAWLRAQVNLYGDL
jgi:hypothetical protein